MPDSVMFRVQEVEVDLTPYDLPGPTRRKVTCARCGQVVRDHREVIKDGQPLCRPCAGGAYFKNAREIIWETINWSPQTQVQMAESPAHLSRFILSKRPHWGSRSEGMNMIKTIRLEEAVGTQLAHDIIEIRPGEFKGPAVRKGHTVCREDPCRMQRLGKNHLYVIDLEADEIRENEAAAILAGALAGEGIVWENNPREGKINMYAARDGLLQVDVPSLAAFNLADEVRCATLHNHTLVKQGELVGGTRALPLIMKRAAIEQAAAIARQHGAVLALRPLAHAQAGLVGENR